jgi:hypothetical protein
MQPRARRARGGDLARPSPVPGGRGPAPSFLYAISHFFHLALFPPLSPIFFFVVSFSFFLQILPLTPRAAALVTHGGSIIHRLCARLRARTRNRGSSRVSCDRKLCDKVLLRCSASDYLRRWRSVTVGRQGGREGGREGDREGGGKMRHGAHF